MGADFLEYQKVRNHWLELCGQGLIIWEGGPGPVASVLGDGLRTDWRGQGILSRGMWTRWVEKLRGQ